MRETPLHVRNIVVSLLQSGLSYRQVADRLVLGYGTVQKIATVSGIERVRPKRGRPSKLSETTKRSIVRNVCSGKYDTAVQAARDLQTDQGITVNPQTIRNVLKSKGLRARHKVKKPAISLRNRKKRLEFAKVHEHWTLADWSRVIWSDETKINRFASDGRLWCWKRNDEGLSNRTTQATVKHGGGSVMIRGCMTANGVGDVKRIEGTMNGQVYCDILSEHLVNTIENHDMNLDEIIFQQDNDPKHTCRKAQKWFEDAEIETMTWPPQSPDLNPIEHFKGCTQKEAERLRIASNRHRGAHSSYQLGMVQDHS